MNDTLIALGVVVLLLVAVIGLMRLWFLRRERRAQRRMAVAVEKDAVRIARLEELPDELGFTLTPSRPNRNDDVLLLGLAALHVEDWNLDHGRWGMTPDRPDRRVTEWVERRLLHLSVAEPDGWRDDLAYDQRQFDDAESTKELAWTAVYLASMIRLGCAAGHIAEDDARELTRPIADRLRTAGCDSWQRFLTWLEQDPEERATERSRRLFDPGMPWHGNSWR